MNAHRRTAVIVGVLLLVAMVTSLAGGIWLEALVGGSDYLSTLAANATQVVIGILLELVNCAAVVGIAAMLFPILRQRSEALAVGYAGFRVVEAAVLALAAIGPLVLAALSQEYGAAGTSGAPHYQTLGALITDTRAQLAGLLTPVFFALGGALLYTFLYQTKLVPRFLSVWGLIGVALVLGWNLLVAFGLSVEAGMVFGLPIILNEITLGIWLIVKGFHPSAIVSGTSRQA